MASMTLMPSPHMSVRLPLSSPLPLFFFSHPLYLDKLEVRLCHISFFYIDSLILCCIDSTRYYKQLHNLDTSLFAP
jgi:hypothetical protein